MKSFATSRFRIGLALALLAGCGDDSAAFDAGGTDASVRDAPVILDASEFVPDAEDVGPSDGGSPSDAGDDAPPALCPGVCRPDEGTCEDLQACVLWSGEPACVLVASGSLGVGTPCEDTDQCMTGLACFQGEAGGVCRRVCCLGDPSACEGEDSCMGPGVLVDGSETEYGACRPPRSCSVLNPDSCGEAEGCYVLEDGETGCRAAGSADVGETCEEPSDCLPGLGCVGAFDKQCARHCRIGAANACPEAEGECRAYADSPEGAGLCSGEASRRRR